MEKKRISILLLAGLLLMAVLGNAVSTQAASKVKLNRKKATITVGKSVTLKVKNAKKKVKWSTSNKKVATVNKKGKVTGEKAGKATITAKVGRQKYKCKVTVKKKQNEGTTEKATEKSTTEETIETPTEATTEEATEKSTGATTEKTTEKTTEATTEKTTEATTEKSTEESTEQQTTENPNNAPSAGTVNYDAGEYSISKVHSGEGTFYDRESGGAANLDFMEDSCF